MEFRRIRSPERQKKEWALAWQLYQVSFPAYLQRSQVVQLAAMDSKAYHCVNIWNKHVYVGLVFYWEWNDFCYIEHFATNSRIWGLNYRQRSLHAFCEKRIGRKIIIETDVPLQRESVEQLVFYEQLGFSANMLEYEKPSYARDAQKMKRILMSRPNVLTEEQYKAFLRYQRTKILPFSDT